MSLSRIFGSGTKVHVHEILASTLRDKAQAKRAFFAQVQLVFRKFVFCRNNRKKPQKVVILLRKVGILVRKIVESLFILSQTSQQIPFIRYDKYQKL